MKIWIDADACPKAAKEIIFRAAIRTQTQLTLVANHLSQIPTSKFINMIIVANGFDEADKRIEAECTSGDLVITGDIPLASLVVAKGCIALNTNGTIYTKATIQQQLAVRNLMAQLRDQQLVSGGPSSYGTSQVKSLAMQLDKLLAQRTT